MEIGDLKDDLLNMGKEKGKELADNFLGEREAEGGITGEAVGFGKDILDKELGGSEAENAGGNQALSAENADNNSDDASSDDDSDDSDNDSDSDDNKN